MPIHWSPAPFGLNDIEVDAADRYSTSATDPLIRGEQVRCCVRECSRWLARRRRSGNRDNAFCPEHGISVSTSPTSVDRDQRRNFLLGHDLLASVTKVESWRLGNEASEDALSWNVFVALSQLGRLADAFTFLTGQPATSQPELYLWGNRIDTASTTPWSRLLEVRRELEDGLAIPTEPDIALCVPGQALALIEAKFGSPNGTLARKKDRYPTVDAYLSRYRCPPGCRDPLAREWISCQPHAEVLEQLCRNVIFARWIAQPDEAVFVVNLVLAKREPDIVDRFTPHLRPDTGVTFRRAVWEDFLPLLDPVGAEAAPLRDYLRNKTLRLRPAFDFAQ
jgi:hypothetical protein